MEKVDELDANYKKTGKVINRNEKLQKGEFCQVVHLCIFDNEDNLLIQKRSDTKKTYPGLWDITCGGAVRAGESKEEAMQRELFEELGLEIDFKNMRPAISFHYFEGLDTIYFLTLKIDLKQIKFMDNEVSMVKYASEEEVINLCKKKEFVSYYESIIHMFFDFNKRKDPYIE